jgi:hypothetical protein
MKVISKIALLCFLLVSTSNLMAQLTISPGLRVGVNLANVSADPDFEIDTESIIGLIFAVPVEIGIGESFAIQPEVMFVQKGFKIEQNLLGFNFESQMIVNQLDIPILAKFKFVNTESFQAYAAAGPVFGYALSGKQKIEALGQSEEEDVDFDEIGYNRFETLVSVGAGAGIPIGPGVIVLDLRYLFGLSDLDDTEDVKVKNNGFQGGIGFMFTFGGND